MAINEAQRSAAANRFHDAVRDGLLASAPTTASRFAAMCVLSEIIRWMNWETLVCEKNASKLAVLLDVNPSSISKTLILLEEVGAIARPPSRSGSGRKIILTPEDLIARMSPSA